MYTMRPPPVTTFDDIYDLREFLTCKADLINKTTEGSLALSLVLSSLCFTTRLLVWAWQRYEPIMPKIRRPMTAID